MTSIQVKANLTLLLVLFVSTFYSAKALATFNGSEVLVKVAPKYPRDAYLNRTEGYVSVIFVVNEKGEAEDIEIVDENPQRIFRKAAVNALKKWRFSPATENGKVVTDIKEITIDFKIN